MAASINADNGAVSGSAGLKSTADSTGVLALQTNGTTAISIDASQAVTFTNSANLPNTFGFKNRIINGAMVIDQRNAGASVTLSAAYNTYTLDRWQAAYSQTSKFTVQQTPSATETGFATRVNAGFTNYLACTSSAATTVGASEYYIISQAIEGFNTADLAWGTANAKTITLSFWVYSSLTGTFGGAINNEAFNRGYPFSYAIPTANTWTQISVTIAGDTTGTWTGATNGNGMFVFFGLGAGSSASGTAGAWGASGYRSATGAVQVVATNGATFYITGVQLEKGATATSFDYRPYASEYFMCCRYFRYWGFSSAWESQTTSSSNHVTWQFPQPMRTLPTLVRIGNLITGRENGTAVTPYQYDASSGSASGTECYIYAQNTTGSTTPIAIGGRGSATAEL